jgi:hypothetical protein
MPAMKTPLPSSPVWREQQGAASLAVVMVLFFIVSMVAAYTSRSLIFEQRTSVNQYRATQALEAAEAGLEWALAQLNQGLIDGRCQLASDAGLTGATSFRQRYLAVDVSTSVVTPRDSSAHPTCVHDGSAWTCDCPAAGNGAPTNPTTAGIYPAFRVSFQAIDFGATPQPGLFRVVVAACTRLDDACLASSSTGAANEGRATVSALVSISGSLAAAPLAALTARGTVDFGSTAVTAINSEIGTGGITIQAGGSVMGSALTLKGPAGTPAGMPISKMVMMNDPQLSAADMSKDRMFVQPFNLTPTSFQQQPALATLNCSGACTDSQVRDLMARNPGKPIWINGDLSVQADIGTATAPVLLVVEAGDLKFNGVSPTVYGAVYLRTPTWTSAGTGTVQGAVIAEGNVGGSGSLTLIHDSAVLAKVRNTVGSLVRVPGTWRDFP